MIISVNRKTLLLSSVAPSNLKTGGIVLSQLAHMIPTDKLVYAVVPDRIHFPRMDRYLYAHYFRQ